MKAIYLLFLVLVCARSMAEYLPYRFDFKEFYTSGSSKETLTLIERSSFLQNESNEVFILPELKLSHEERIESVNSSLIEDIEKIEDAMALLKHDNFLKEILFVKERAEYYRLTNSEYSKLLDDVYKDISKKFLVYVRNENKDLSKLFKLRTKEVLKKYGYKTSENLSEYIADFYDIYFNDLFNQKIMTVTVPLKEIAPKYFKSHSTKLNKPTELLKLSNIKVKTISDLNGTPFSSFEIKNQDLLIHLNLRGYRQQGKHILPIQLYSMIPMSRDVKIDIDCNFQNIDEEEWGDRIVDVQEDLENYEQSISQEVFKNFIQRDTCSLRVENVDLEKDLDFLTGLLTEELKLDELKKQGSFSKSLVFKKGESRAFPLQTNLRFEK